MRTGEKVLNTQEVTMIPSGSTACIASSIGSSASSTRKTGANESGNEHAVSKGTPPSGGRTASRMARGPSDGADQAAPTRWRGFGSPLLGWLLAATAALLA